MQLYVVVPVDFYWIAIDWLSLWRFGYKQMANELIIPLGDNITLKIRDNDSGQSNDLHWLCLLTAFIILISTTLILITVLAVYLSTSQTKPLNTKLTALINLLAIATYSDCLLGRSLSLVSAIIYVYKPPHQIFCRLTAASSIFVVILQNLCISGIAMPKFFRTALRLWILLFIAGALAVPFLNIPTYITASNFFNRNVCQRIWNSSIYYYILALTVLVFIPSWLAMLSFIITYKCNKYPLGYMGVDDQSNKDGRFVSILILLYIFLVTPKIISIIMDDLFKYTESDLIDGVKFESITTWLSVIFWFSWPCLVLYMYPTVGSAFKTLILDCRHVRSFTSSKNIYCDSTTPVLMATSDGLFLRNTGDTDKQIDLTLIGSDLSSNSAKQTTVKSADIQQESVQAVNRKMVRFAFHVTHIPETSNVYQSLPSYHSSSSSSM